MVKNLLAKQGTWVHSLGQEDPWEKEMGTHSGILIWKVPWTEEPGGHKRARHNLVMEKQQLNQCSKRDKQDG